MPVQILPYIKGIIQGHKVTATFLQLQFGYSHDRLTRTLQKRFSWQHILLWIVTRFFGVLSNGYLIIDDTVIAKPFSKKLEGAGFAYSSSLDATVYGYHVVLLVWTNGILTIPLAWRFYRKNDKSKIKLAQELLELARNTWNINPTAVLFDSYYAAEKLLNQIHEYDWTFTCRIKKNRIVNSASVNDDLTEERDSLVGLITGKVKGRVIRHDDKFFLSNDLSLTYEQILFQYRLRWPIEEVFKFLKSQLHLEACQARSRTAQENHLGSCIMAYLLIQKEQLHHQNKSLYSIKWSWIINKRLANNRFRHYVKVLTA